MIETVFDQKGDVTILSHKVRFKDKEIKRHSKIRVKCNPRKKRLKGIRKYESSTKKKKETRK